MLKELYELLIRRQNRMTAARQAVKVAEAELKISGEEWIAKTIRPQLNIEDKEAKELEKKYEAVHAKILAKFNRLLIELDEANADFESLGAFIDSKINEDNKIRIRAYYLSLSSSSDDELQNWLTAEKELFSIANHEY